MRDPHLSLPATGPHATHEVRNQVPPLAGHDVADDGARAWLVGEPGRGIATILEMVTATRLGSAAQARLACVTAAHYVSVRRAFGAPVIDHPAMSAVIADLTLESEAATALALRLAGAADATARGDRAEADFLRLALPAAKFWVCKRVPAVTAEALACQGGNGYAEDSGLPRLYRDAPLNSIWEGSGKRHRPGRAAGAGPLAAGRGRRPGRRSARRPEPTGGSTRRPAGCAGSCRPPWRRDRRRGTWPGGWPAC